MIITRELLAQKLIAYLQHDSTLAQLVSWAEDAMMDAAFDPSHHDTVRSIIGRLGVADVRAFGLTWEGIKNAITDPRTRDGIL